MAAPSRLGVMFPPRITAESLAYVNAQRLQSARRSRGISNYRTVLDGHAASTHDWTVREREQDILQAGRRKISERYMANIIGHYRVACESIYSDESLDVVIRLDPGAGKLRLVADFDLVDLEGSMHLGSSPSKIPHEPVPGLSYVERYGQPVHRRRNHTTQDSSFSQMPVHQPGRVYLVWRGRETGEGEMQIDDADQRGWMHFADEACTTFTGQIQSAYWGLSNWAGSKVNGQPGPRQYDFEEYTRRAYDFESRDRWRRH